MSYTFPLSRYYELIRHVLFQISENTDSQKPIDIKISGDGAQITRLSTYMLLSFSILQSQQEVMSSQGKKPEICKMSLKWYFLLFNYL